MEIGIPFSDPIADGPTIQQAMKDALSRGTTPQDTLKVIKAIRLKSQVPIVLFSYANPLLAAGNDFLESIKEAGCNGILIIDLPIKDPLGISLACQRANLEQIIVVSPSTSLERMQSFSLLNSGFVYYACRKGVTGARKNLPEDLPNKMTQLRKVFSIPIAVGFGISNHSHASDVLKIANGFVVGSAFVQAIDKGASTEELTQLAKKINPRSSQ